LKALRLYGQHDIRLEDVAPPESPGPDEVLVAPLRAGICGTDLREYVGSGGAAPDEPHPLTGVTKPVILGHEFSARVIAVGEGVNSTRAGDHVAVLPLLHCGTCAACLRGEYNLCEDKAWTGLSTRWGGFGELALIPAYQATPMPALSDLQGAVVEPAAVALHAVDRARVGEGQTVLVIGCGPIGALAILASLACGAATVFFTEPHAKRAALGCALGGVHVDDTETIWSRTAGAGVDSAIDCAGKQAGLELALDAVRMGGIISIPGVHTRPPTLNVWRITRRSLELRGSQGYSRSAWDRTIALAAAGRYPIERIVTSSIPFSDIVSRGFDTLQEPGSGELKVIVEVN
jgi:(R,R)-butanediol dehydrogenase/meso-butanediol dehydrogenase/diacetyl reductase